MQLVNVHYVLFKLRKIYQNDVWKKLRKISSKNLEFSPESSRKFLNKKQIMPKIYIINSKEIIFLFDFHVVCDCKRTDFIQFPSCVKLSQKAATFQLTRDWPFKFGSIIQKKKNKGKYQNLILKCPKATNLTQSNIQRTSRRRRKREKITFLWNKFQLPKKYIPS